MLTRLEVHHTARMLAADLPPFVFDEIADHCRKCERCAEVIYWLADASFDQMSAKFESQPIIIERK